MAKRVLSVIVVLIIGLVLMQMGVPRRVAGLMVAVGAGYVLSRSSPYEPSMRELMHDSNREARDANGTPARDENAG